MKILVLGGTVFLGRHIVEAALRRGHQLTLFNRGLHGTALPAHVEHLRGDRDDNVSELAGRSFDAVIDTSCYTAKHARAVAAVLRNRIGHYTFISTVSVHAAFPPHQSFDEDTPVQSGEDGYGACKARAEDFLERAYPQKLATVRPGLIVGPFDPSDRFTYWPRRVALGGEILAPGRPQRPIQLVDVRDLAHWCIDLAEQTVTGTFNACGPKRVLTMEEMLEACRSALHPQARFTWIPDDRLLAQNVFSWTEMPLWLPEEDPDFGGFLLGDNRRAVDAGLSFRPLSESILDTYRWDCAPSRSRVDLPTRVTPMSTARESEVLAAVAAPRAIS